MFENFYGNAAQVSTLERMIESGRISQTLLLSGPEGVGKATLARRFASVLLGAAQKIEADDLSLDANRTRIADREKWTSDKRGDDPLFFSTHPDFVTFCPEGPLRQISIQQMRSLREQAQLMPLKGKWRVFLIDQFDRTSQQAADSILKTLEEPPPYLILIMTAENVYDLPSTIRSRSIQLHLSPLSVEEMDQFMRSRSVPNAEKRLALAGGCPGLAVTLDLEAYEKRRGVMLAMLDAAASSASFADWVRKSESFLASKSEKLELSLRPLYALLEDLLILQHGGTNILNRDLEATLKRLSERVSFDWIVQAVERVDEFSSLQRRNVQKGPLLDDLVTSLRSR